MDVDFERSGSRRFDLVIGADGTHSTIRRLAFGPESRYARLPLPRPGAPVATPLPAYAR